jgi:uncharacterized protein DUF6011
MNKQLRGADIPTFVLAGNAIFTLSNPETGGRFTYRVRASEDGRVHFVSVLTGTDNENSYRYLGVIRRGAFEHGRKSTIGASAPSARAFAWFWAHRADPSPAVVLHSGRCGRCNRTLTVPQSLETGLGPECAGRVAAYLTPYTGREIAERAEAIRGAA